MMMKTNGIEMESSGTVNSAGCGHCCQPADAVRYAPTIGVRNRIPTRSESGITESSPPKQSKDGEKPGFIDMLTAPARIQGPIGKVYLAFLAVANLILVCYLVSAAVTGSWRCPEDANFEEFRPAFRTCLIIWICLFYALLVAWYGYGKPDLIGNAPSDDSFARKSVGWSIFLLGIVLAIVLNIGLHYLFARCGRYYCFCSFERTVADVARGQRFYRPIAFVSACLVVTMRVNGANKWIWKPDLIRGISRVACLEFSTDGRTGDNDD
jgi:hypothetical protein